MNLAQVRQELKVFQYRDLFKIENQIGHGHILLYDFPEKITQKAVCQLGFALKNQMWQRVRLAVSPTGWFPRWSFTTKMWLVRTEKEGAEHRYTVIPASESPTSTSMRSSCRFTVNGFTSEDFRAHAHTDLFEVLQAERTGTNPEIVRIVSELPPKRKSVVIKTNISSSQYREQINALMNKNLVNSEFEKLVLSERCRQILKKFL